MAEILFCASDRGAADQNHEKGDIVHVAPDGWQWGAREVAPSFVRVNVPGLNPSTITDRLENWNIVPVITVVQSDLATDTFRLRITNSKVNSQLGAITRAQVERFITNWGGSVVSVAANEVVFDVRITDALMSLAWWEGARPQVSEDSFASDTHTMTVQAPGVSAQRLRAFLEEKGAVVLAVQDGQATYSIGRARVRQDFEDDLAEKASRVIIRRKRFYLDPIRVDQILTAGGVANYTATQLNNRVRDRLAE